MDTVTGSPNETRPTIEVTAVATSRTNWFAFVRAVWVLVAALAFAIFMLSIPTYGHQLAQATKPAWVFELIAVLASLGSTFTCFALASLFFLRKGDDRIALLVSFYLIVYGISSPMGRLEAFLPGATTLARQAESLTTILMVILLVLFPDGRFTPHWTRWLVVFSTTWLLITFFIPFWWAERPLSWIGGFCWVLSHGAALYAQIYRYRYVSNPTQRQQTKWVIFGFSLRFLLMIVVGVLYILVWNLPPDAPLPWWYSMSSAGWSLSMNMVPLSLTIAVMRYRLWDIDFLINRTLVYGSLTAIVIGIYVLVVGSLGALFQSSGNPFISLLATGTIAALFQPLRERLQRAINRLMFGERDDPVTVLSRLGQGLEATITPEAMLLTLVETVAKALRLPYVALELRDGQEFRIAASHGQPVSEPFRFPLISQHLEVIGQLMVAPRAGSETLTAADQQLLKNIAHQAGAAVRTVRLTTDLQRSREHLVAAREEERRRLRRDLHDGLGPALATLSLQAEVARDLVHSDPRKSEAMLNEVVAGTQAAISDIRRVVYALRPPALDDLGLVSALQEQVTRYMQGGLRITLDVPESLPSLPAAVEVAAYRIVQEALTNVVRHAQAHTCLVCLRVNGSLELDISDDGQGMTEMRRAGVGLNSMYERATELGGTCEIRSVPGGGTSIHVILPGQHG